MKIPHYNGQYLTVYNKRTRRSVPFKRSNGEVVITSSRIEDDEDSCVVMVGNLFYEHSLDLTPRGKIL